MQLSEAVRNARLDAVETTIGTAPVLRILSGAIPATCATAQSGTLLASPTVPSDWMGAASAGAKSGSSLPWADSSADATGEAGYYRILNTAASTCHAQGLVSQAWAASTAFPLNRQVHNGGNVYQCTTAGTSAGSGGPTGTGTGISDGSCAWAYLGTQEMTIQNGSIATGQPVSVTSFALTEGGA